MMKKVLFLSIIALCACADAFSQDIVNLRMNRSQMGLRGDVASVDEDILLRKDYFREDWPQRKWFVGDLRNILREDQGRIVTFNRDGLLLTITYTLQGKPGKKTACSYASNGLLASYLGEGYKVEARYKNNTADINIFAETKDYKSPNLAKADLNQTPYVMSYPFDLKCRQLLSDEGLVLSSSYFYVDSMPAMEYVYNYNHINQLVGEKCTDYTSGEKVVSTVRYGYDNQGFLVAKTVHSKAVDETWTYVNNELGDVTSLTIERPYGTVVYTFQYVYDEQDNWTVRLQFEDGIFDCAALRTLTYHKGSKSSELKNTSPANSDKEAKLAQRQADKEAKAAARAAEKEARAAARAAEKAERDRTREAEKNMTKEERKAARDEQKAIENARKEKAAAEKKAEKEKAAAEKKAQKEKAAAEKKAEKEKAAAEKKAEKEKAAAEKQRKAAEKQAAKQRKSSEK